jgi:glucokinase
MPGAYPILVADIGGTHARFGLVHGRDEAPVDVETLPGENYRSLTDALAAYLASVAGRPPRRGCIAVAGPVEEGHFILTNRPAWSTPLAPLQAEHHLDDLEVINDFQALAAALPLLLPEDIWPIGEERPAEPGAPMAVVGPGTGLGVGATVKTALGWQPVPSEGGHVELASAYPRARQAIDHVTPHFGRVSAERFLSGPGLELLHVTLGKLDAAPRQPLDAAAIASRAVEGDPQAHDTISIFLQLLAGFAGDVALMFGARGGVFLGGGVTARLRQFLDPAAFRESFEDKGRLRPYLQAIPLSILGSDTLALRGCAAHLDRVKQNA